MARTNSQSDAKRVKVRKFSIKYKESFALYVILDIKRTTLSAYLVLVILS